MFDPPSNCSQTKTWLVLNSWHIALLLLPLLRDWVMLQHFPIFKCWPLLRELRLPFVKDRPRAQASLDGQRGVLESMPKSPHVRGARGCWLTTRSSHEQGVDGKDGQVRERVWVLVTAGLVSAPCSCSANKKRLKFPPWFSLPECIPGKSCEWNWINWSCVEVAVKANAVAEGVTCVYMKLSLVALLICSELTPPLF